MNGQYLASLYHFIVSSIPNIGRIELFIKPLLGLKERENDITNDDCGKQKRNQENDLTEIFKDFVFCEVKGNRHNDGQQVPKTIKPRLYRIVLRMAINASLLLNRYVKFLKLTHGLWKIPSE